MLPEKKWRKWVGGCGATKGYRSSHYSLPQILCADLPPGNATINLPDPTILSNRDTKPFVNLVWGWRFWEVGSINICQKIKRWLLKSGLVPDFTGTGWGCRRPGILFLSDFHLKGVLKLKVKATWKYKIAHWRWKWYKLCMHCKSRWVYYRGTGGHGEEGSEGLPLTITAYWCPSLAPSSNPTSSFSEYIC